MLNRTIFALSVLLLLPGCSSPALTTGSRLRLISSHPEWPQATIEQYKNGRLSIGMTKSQVFTLTVSPNWWSRFEINGDVYESWNYASGCGFADTIDFKNDLVIGYSHAGKYYSQKSTTDLTNYRHYQ